MKKIFATAMLLAVISSSFVFSEEEEKIVTLTVEEAVECAKKNSRTLKSSQIDLAIKERAAKYSWNVFLPSVSVSGTAARSTNIESNLEQMNGMAGLAAQLTKTPYTPKTDQEKYHWAIVGNVGASLNLSLSYIGQIKAAKAGYEGGKITLEQSEKQTLMNVRKLFYGLLVQQASLDVKKNSLENARQRAEQAEANYRNGLIPELRLLNAQVTYENQRPEVQSAEQALNQQLDTFAFMIGLPVGTKIELVGSLEPEYVVVNTDELLEKYAQNSLDILSLKSNLEVLKCNLDALNFSSFTPALVLDYAWKPTKTFYSDSSKWPDQGALSITLAWNLTNMLPFSSNRQKAADLKDNIAKLELTMETLTENQKTTVRKAVDTLNQAREQIDSMGRNIELAQRAYDSSARSYRNGTTELLDLRDSESQLNQAKLGQLNQKFNYISALMDLEYTLNADLSSYKE